MRKYMLCLVPVLCCLLLAACKMDLSGSAPTPPPAKVVKAPEVVTIPQSQSPDDIKLVTAALIERLRGGLVPVQNVTFDPAGQHYVGEPGFTYDNFDVKDVAITGYVPTKLGGNTVQVIMEGLFLFTDILNRRAGVYFAVQYTVTRSGITITKSVTRGIPPDFPRVETFFVPASKLRAAAPGLVSYVDYYLFVIENAEPMTYGPDGDKTGLKDDYLIVTFCKDRLFQESELAMTVTERAYGAGKKLAEAVCINDSGWRILIAGGKFAPGSRINKFYVGVTYKQDPSTQLPAVVVGEFMNVKTEYVEDAPAPAAQAPAAQAAPAPAAAAQPAQSAPAGPAPVNYGTAAGQSGDGPLALGQQFLNPVFPGDVEVIQVRLRQLGLYKGKIDRNFGPMTKNALDAFNVRHGFPKGQWSLGVQKELFKGTGQ